MKRSLEDNTDSPIDFFLLRDKYPYLLEQYIGKNDKIIDFTNSHAMIALTKAILLNFGSYKTSSSSSSSQFYNPLMISIIIIIIIILIITIIVDISIELPSDRLCPPVPGRLAYIDWLKTLIDSNTDKTSNDDVHILDIGVGTSCIYPLLGSAKYEWKFTGNIYHCELTDNNNNN